MSVQNLANIIIAYKAQSGLGTPASGSGATGLEVTASPGLSMQSASITSPLLQLNRQTKRPRAGSNQVPTSYDTLLRVGTLDPAIAGVLGGTWSAAGAFDETDWGALTITGTGTVLTFASGTIVTDGIVAGMFGRLTGMSVTANDGVWFPILNAAEGVLTIPSGFLADNTSDAAWDIEIAPALYSPSPYVKTYFTVEEYLGDIDRSKLGTDMQFNSLGFTCQADQPVGVSLGLAGRDLSLLASGSSPSFSSPTFNDGPALVLLDGGIYVKGVKEVDITALNWTNAAAVGFIPVVGTRTSPDVSIGQFALTGQLSIPFEDGDFFDDYIAETQISVLLHCKEPDTDEFFSFYLGNLAYAAHQSPGGGEGGQIQTLPLYGGSDDRGAGFAASAIVASTSFGA